MAGEWISNDFVEPASVKNYMSGAKSSGNADGPAAKISAKARHNKKQREFYKRRQKARKVQLVKLAESETVVGEASAAPSETGL